MEVFGSCRKCGKQFDAHWHNYPELSSTEAIMKPYCPYCKSLDIHVTTDESNDYYDEDYDEISDGGYEEDD